MKPISYNKKQGTWKTFIPGGSHRVLLRFQCSLLNEHPEIHIKWDHLSNVLHLGEHLVNCSNFESHIHSTWQSESEIDVTQSCLTLCDPMECSLPGSSVHGIFQARILEWVAISFSKRPSRLRDQTCIPPCLAASLPLSHLRSLCMHHKPSQI